MAFVLCSILHSEKIFYPPYKYIKNTFVCKWKYKNFWDIYFLWIKLDIFIFFMAKKRRRQPPYKNDNSLIDSLCKNIKNFMHPDIFL